MIVHEQYPLDERVARETRIAQGAGYRVDVICLRGEGEPAREVVDRATVHRLPVAHRRGVGWFRMAVDYVLFTILASVAVVLTGGRRGYDVVQIHSPPDFLAAAGLVPKLRGSRLVLDIHDITSLMYAARFGDSRAGGLAHRALIGIERVAGSLADSVVTVHDPYRREIAGHGIAAEKITIFMNSPDEERIGEARKARIEQAAADGFHVIYHGTVTGWYGVPLLVEAAGLLREHVDGLHVTIIGDGDDLPRAHAVAREAGVEDLVEFSNCFLPNEHVLMRAANADCGVVPNLPSPLNRLTLSSKLLEYVALGVPAVVAELETLRAHFDPDEVTFFRPGDPAALADALRWVAAHPDEARKKAKRARERARAYDWHQNRARYADMLERLVVNGRRGSTFATAGGDA